MKFSKILMIANGALVLLLAVQLGNLALHPPTPMAMASWKDRPDSAEETTALAENVVHVKVKKVRKAKPLSVKIDGEPGGMDVIPVEVVTLEILADDVKGGKKKGEQIELFRTGDSSMKSPGKRTDKPKEKAPPKPDPADGDYDSVVEEKDAEKAPASEAHMGVLFSAIMGDPVYKVGEEYLMFVREGPELTVDGRKVATSAVVSPEGRFRVEAGKLQPMSDKAWAKGLRGKPIKELKDKAAKAVAKGKGKPTD